MRKITLAVREWIKGEKEKPLLSKSRRCWALDWEVVPE